MIAEINFPPAPFTFNDKVPILETVTFDANNIRRRPDTDGVTSKGNILWKGLIKPRINCLWSAGYTDYSFINYVSHADRSMCLPNETIDHSGEDSSGRTLYLKCMPGFGNGSLLIANSIKDIAHILTPLGNITNRSEPGNCALVLFYKRSAPISEKIVLLFNFMPVLFPDIRVGAIDSDRFHLVNYEFGIIGVPTVMLFHEGWLRLHLI